MAPIYIRYESVLVHAETPTPVRVRFISGPTFNRAQTASPAAAGPRTSTKQHRPPRTDPRKRQHKSHQSLLGETQLGHRIDRTISIPPLSLTSPTPTMSSNSPDNSKTEVSRHALTPAPSRMRRHTQARITDDLPFSHTRTLSAPVSLPLPLSQTHTHSLSLSLSLFHSPSLILQLTLTFPCSSPHSFLLNRPVTRNIRSPS